MRETLIEQHLVRLAREAGGMALKWTAPGFTGVPDRLVFLPGGLTALVETKTAGGELSARQQLVHRQLAAIGHRVWVPWSKDEVEHVMRSLLR